MPETEQRYFVWQSQAFAAAGAKIPELVQEVARRISLPFFSVDIVQRRDGQWRVVEVGDGQVSDVVGWNTAEFVRMFD